MYIHANVVQRGPLNVLHAECCMQLKCYNVALYPFVDLNLGVFLAYCTRPGSTFCLFQSDAVPFEDISCSNEDCCVFNLDS